MTNTHHHTRASEKYFSTKRLLIVGLVLAAFALVLSTHSPRTPFASAEVQFTDLSAHGLAIVPASCPSDPHYAGECSAAPPVGVLDSAADCNNVSGWAYDPDVPSQSIDVHFYVNGPTGSGTFAGAVNANISRPDVNAAYSITGNHGYSFSVPSQFRDNAPHSIYPYAIDPSGNGNDPLLSGAPKTFTCAAPPVCSTPLNATSDSRGLTLLSSTVNRWLNSLGSSFCISNSSGNSYFIPANTSPELQSFVNAIPGLPGVSQTAR